MTPKEMLQLANSLLQGSLLQEDLQRFQCNSRNHGTGQLTESWQKGFMSRHDTYVQTKKGYHVNHLRMDNLTEDNVEAMYDMTYKTWTAARCAVRLSEDKYHYVDASGNRTSIIVIGSWERKMWTPFLGQRKPLVSKLTT